MENEKKCKSCGVSMTEDAHFGTNADGSKNEEYCSYCLQNGKTPKYCQSCGMPMTEDAHFGTNADGSKNEEYCSYCFKDGRFTGENLTLEQMIEVNIPYLMEAGFVKTEDEARKVCQEYIPQLKRWAK